ncbi:MAG: hypothetical protein OEM00_07550, partial [Burkholderiaceae bacterium]|nr:hypothetical protein [Burkholderiaceae bacterium]
VLLHHGCVGRLVHVRKALCTVTALGPWVDCYAEGAAQGPSISSQRNNTMMATSLEQTALEG